MSRTVDRKSEGKHEEALPAYCNAVRSADRDVVIHPSPSWSAMALQVKGADASEMVEKEAKRLEVVKRRQERELAQMVQYELMRKELQVYFHDGTNPDLLGCISLHLSNHAKLWLPNLQAGNTTSQFLFSASGWDVWSSAWGHLAKRDWLDHPTLYLCLGLIYEEECSHDIHSQSHSMILMRLLQGQIRFCTLSNIIV